MKQKKKQTTASPQSISTLIEGATISGPKTLAYTERDLMSTYTPKIVDHYLLARDERSTIRKFLVKWYDTSKHEGKSLTNDDSVCASWVQHEDFLFPALARSYLLKTLNNKSSEKKIELEEWVVHCIERENFLISLNTIPNDDDDDEDREIDFSCFLCKCPEDHPLQGTIRNCEYLRKYHRGCCHDYRDTKEFDDLFVSPMGKIVRKLIELTGTATNETKGETDTKVSTTTHPELGNENDTGISHDSYSVSVVEGKCELFLQCLQACSTLPRLKRNAVVLCINSGFGSAAVALKGLGIRVDKMIHVEADRVAQHVIRSNHDISYGVTQVDDGIKHIVGLYETIDDIVPEMFIQYNGPIGKLRR